MIGLAIRVVLLAGLLWAGLVYGISPLQRGTHAACSFWNIQGGVCTPAAQEKLAAFDAWVQRTLRPLPRHPQVQQTVAQVQGAFSQLEVLARKQVGDEDVNAALHEATLALAKLETVAGSTGRDARAKVAAIPGNARAVLQEARAAVDRLALALSVTTERAEDLSRAVRETRHALDAVSAALPEAK